MAEAVAKAYKVDPATWVDVLGAGGTSQHGSAAMGRSRRVHFSDRPSCTRDVVQTLANMRQPLTLSQIRAVTMDRWETTEICSVIVKLRKRGQVMVLPPVFRDGAVFEFSRYVWIL